MPVTTVPLPLTTYVWVESMDPADKLDYTIDCGGMLEVGETIASYTLLPLADASALGLTVLNAGGYTTSIINGTKIRAWFSITSGFQGDTAFRGVGVILPLELTLTTTSVPSRIKQRTVAVRVAER